MSAASRFAGAVVFSFLSGCSAAPRAHVAPAREFVSPSEMLSRDELASLDAPTAADAVRRLRPQFLRGSARQPVIGSLEIAVYLDGKYDGGVSSLATIPLDAIEQIVFLHEAAAYTRYGPMCRCANGAIVIATAQRR
jgi:hypothetical protein